MEIDTSSPVCVISWDAYNKHRVSWPPLEKSELKLSCYLGPLPVASKLILPLSYGDKTVTVPVTVLRQPGSCLSSPDLIKKLNNLGVPVLCLSRSASQEEDVNLEAILADYCEVFEPGLSLFNVPPAHLYVKEGVKEGKQDRCRTL